MAVLADLLNDVQAIGSLPELDQPAALIAAADRAVMLAGAVTVGLVDSGATAGSSRLSNPGHWLAHTANVSQTRGRSVVASARLADRYDAIAEGVDEGVLHTGHLTLLKKCVPENRTHYRAERFADHHKMLVDLARELDYPDFKNAVEAWIGLCEDAV